MKLKTFLNPFNKGIIIPKQKVKEASVMGAFLSFNNQGLNDDSEEMPANHCD